MSKYIGLIMGELFRLSVILHFPPEVYLRRGVGELAPLLVRALHEREISALQFLRGGLARVTVRSSAYREELLSSDFMFEDTPIPVTPADHPTISVYLRDLPIEISDDSVRSALESFGYVFSVRSTVYKDFPSIRNGTRVLLMSVKQPIPSSLNALGFTCRTWYPGQPAFCSICRQSGHLPRACPLSGLCRRCKQPGHVARECPQARGSSQSSSVPVCEVPPDPVPVPDVPLDPALAPVSEVPPVPVPVSDVSLSSDSSSVEIEVSPPDPPEESAPAPVPTPKPAKSFHAAKSSSPAADFKKIVRVALLKTKPVSSPAQVRRLVSTLISANKFVVSPDDVERVVESICNSK